MKVDIRMTVVKLYRYIPLTPCINVAILKKGVECVLKGKSCLCFFTIVFHLLDIALQAFLNFSGIIHQSLSDA